MQLVSLCFILVSFLHFPRIFKHFQVCYHQYILRAIQTDLTLKGKYAKPSLDFILCYNSAGLSFLMSSTTSFILDPELSLPGGKVDSGLLSEALG